jgi:hypothetical protein
MTCKPLRGSVCTSIPSYRSVLGKHPCTAFQGVNVAASIQPYGRVSDHACGPKSRVMCKRPWALTRGHYGTLQYTSQQNQTRMKKVSNLSSLGTIGDAYL